MENVDVKDVKDNEDELKQVIADALKIEPDQVEIDLIEEKDGKVILEANVPFEVEKPLDFAPTVEEEFRKILGNDVKVSETIEGTYGYQGISSDLTPPPPLRFKNNPPLFSAKRKIFFRFSLKISFFFHREFEKR